MHRPGREFGARNVTLIKEIWKDYDGGEGRPAWKGGSAWEGEADGGGPLFFEEIPGAYEPQGVIVKKRGKWIKI